MNIPAVRFNKQDRPEFFKELKKRVNAHFKENQISKHANLNMKIKTVFMIILYFTPLILMLSGFVKTTGMAFLMWTIMGFGVAGIGLSIMHDACHGSYSSNKRVNNALGFILNFLGGFHKNWIIQHNVLHHSYTNIHGMDEDIDKGVMRMSPDQPMNRKFRFQAFYAPFLYCLLTLFWVIAKDFQQLNRYHKKGLLEAQGLTYRSALAQIIFHKIWYYTLILVLPTLVVGLPFGIMFLGFLLMHFIGGLILALIFQAAHVLEETHFFQMDDQNSVENNWAIHQMHTTANFAKNSGFFSWFIGGLNYQVEHHLFPNICHVHYPQISKIVKQTAQEFGVPYYEHRTFLGALKSHFSLIHRLGTGAYDREVELAKSQVAPRPENVLQD